MLSDLNYSALFWTKAKNTQACVEACACSPRGWSSSSHSWSLLMGRLRWQDTQRQSRSLHLNRHFSGFFVVPVSVLADYDSLCDKSHINTGPDIVFLNHTTQLVCPQFKWRPRRQELCPQCLAINPNKQINNRLSDPPHCDQSNQKTTRIALTCKCFLRHWYVCESRILHCSPLIWRREAYVTRKVAIETIGTRRKSVLFALWSLFTLGSYSNTVFYLCEQAPSTSDIQYSESQQWFPRMTHSVYIQQIIPGHDEKWGKISNWNISSERKQASSIPKHAHLVKCCMAYRGVRENRRPRESLDFVWTIHCRDHHPPISRQATSTAC